MGRLLVAWGQQFLPLELIFHCHHPDFDQQNPGGFSAVHSSYCPVPWAASPGPVSVPGTEGLKDGPLAMPACVPQLSAPAASSVYISGQLYRLRAPCNHG